MVRPLLAKLLQNPLHDCQIVTHLLLQYTFSSRFALATCRSLTFGSLAQQGSGFGGGGSSGPTEFGAGSM